MSPSTLEQRYTSLRRSTSHAAFSDIDSYVQQLGGDRVIRRVLIANNGTSAVKGIRSIQQWAYHWLGDEHAIELIAMATPEDITANAEFIRRASTFVEVPGGSNKNNYANVALIVDLAVRLKVDAVWAGWGHASEDPKLPESLAAAPGDIRFVGPPASAMRALGDKISSTIVAQARSSQVPTLGWSGSGIVLEDELTKIAAATSSSGSEADAAATSSSSLGERVPREVYRRACLESAEEAIIKAGEVGYPVMLKASEGGGGKGIRMVHSEEEMRVAYRLVTSEVPGSPVFCMKLAPEARHLEVQILADAHGNVMSLFGRDCSVQRRHQKIMEEGPVTIASEAVAREMEEAAIRLAKEVNYVSAGTVEYLYFGDRYYFLELNPRLQVEHPVTEMITGVNLPACQLQVAMGIPLGRIPDVRRLYGFNPTSSDLLDVAKMPRPTPRGHVVAVRITAENPELGFKPTSGQIQELTFNSTPNVWGYFSVGSSGGGLHEFADSQFGHLFSWAPNRSEALAGMVVALKEVSIRGDIHTPVEFLVQILETEEMQNNTFHNGWLDAIIASEVTTERADPYEATLCGAAFLAERDFAERWATAVEHIRRGQMVPTKLLTTIFEQDILHEGIKYPAFVMRTGEMSLDVRIAGTNVEVEIRPLSDGGFLISFGGKSRVVYSKDDVTGLRLLIDGRTSTFPHDVDPTKVIALSPGKLVRHLVSDGTHVTAGSSFAEMEVMKMFMPMIVAESGVIHFTAPEGTILKAGDLVATLTLDDPSRVKRAKVFDGEFPQLASASHFASARVDQVALRFMNIARHVFRGYCSDFSYGDRSFDAHCSTIASTLSRCVKNPHLPRHRIAEIVSNISSHMPMGLRDEVDAILARAEIDGKALETDDQGSGYGQGKGSSDAAKRSASSRSGTDTDDAALRTASDAYVSALGTRIIEAIGRFRSKLNGDAAKSFDVGLAPLTEIAREYSDNPRTDVVRVFAPLLDLYLEIEERFGSAAVGAEESFASLRDAHDPEVVAAHVLSHGAIRHKNVLLSELLSAISSYFHCDVSLLQERLAKISKLHAKSHSAIALKARRIMSQLPSFGARLASVVSTLEAHIAKQGISAGPVGTPRAAHGKELLSGNVASSSSAPASTTTGDDAAFHALVDKTVSAEDVLAECLFHDSPSVRASAAEAHVRRAYCAYEIDGLHTTAHALAPEKIGDSAAGSDGCTGEHWPGVTVTAKWRFLPRLDTDNSMTSFMNAPAAGRDEPFTPRIAANSGDNRRRPAVMVVHNTIDDVIAQLKRSVEFAKKSFGNSGQILSMPDGTRKGAVAASVVQAEGTLSPAGTVYLAFRAPVACSVATNSEDTATCRETGADGAWTDFEGVLSDPSVHAQLREAGIQRVTLMAIRREDYPIFRTYRSRNDFKEDELTRDFDPPLAFQLQLSMMSPFELRAYPLGSPHIRILLGEAHHGEDTGRDTHVDRRYFVRIIVRQGVHFSKLPASEYVRLEGERLFVEALDALEAAMHDPAFGPSVNNQVFFNFLPVVELRPETVGEIMHRIVVSHGKRIWDLHVRMGEMSIACRMASGKAVRLRFKAKNTSQFAVHTSVEREVRLHRGRSDSTYDHDHEDEDGQNQDQGQDQGCDDEGSAAASTSASEGTATSQEERVIYSLPTIDITRPYEPASDLELKRFASQRYGTTFVYDIPELMDRMLAKELKKHGVSSSSDSQSAFVSCKELVVDSETGDLVETDREPCLNDCGMVAWLIVARTPPSAAGSSSGGRPIVVIANDITYRAGSFSVAEDDFFEKASRYARERGIPRVYFSCNSGARLALAEEVQRAFRVSWVSPENPSRGFSDLYLTDAELEALGEGVVITEKVAENCNVIRTVIGRKRGIGVENLRASGMIAGETSRAYDECFTLTIVTGRCVGIGSYLVRLGQRTIQCNNAPILLTGEAALNKVLGRQVYTSNLQLGGPGIMYPNGVSHVVANNLRDSVEKMWKWLFYIPESRGKIANPLTTVSGSLVDPIERDVTFTPPGEAYDPRLLLTGEPGAKGGVGKTSGLFDEGSFFEVLGGWARTVITGRARLAGHPVGVITTETRTIECVIPADPASPDGKEEIRQQAGQVWYPDSAFKTAQAIKDIQREGLPLFILASWRGFSGGRRDMFEEILKFGSYIVDALREFTQPVFVYLPPRGELRGGAWVVLDPTINESHMEMHADTEARAGILEPAGIVEIKYREPALIATMKRIDPTLAEMNTTLKDGGLSAKDRSLIKEKIDKRIGQLLPIYGQVATQFAELHDTPQRMKAVGAIEQIVPWRDARRFYANRLNLRLKEQAFARRAGCEATKAREVLAALYSSEVANATSDVWAADAAANAWLDAHENEIDAAVKREKVAALQEKLLAMMGGDSDLFEEALAAAKSQAAN